SSRGAPGARNWAHRVGRVYFELPPTPPPPGESRLFLALSGYAGPGVLEVPGVTGSEVRGAGPIPREPDPAGGGAVVVWASAAPCKNCGQTTATMNFITRKTSIIPFSLVSAQRCGKS